MRKVFAVVSLFMLMLSTSTWANARDLDLSNTGINLSGIADQSYTYTYPAINDISNPVILEEGVYPLDGTWLDNDARSKWVTLPYTVPASAIWQVSTTFTLLDTDDLASVVINGRWMVDNEGLAIQLNGHNIGFGTGLGEESFTTWTDFLIDNASGYTQYLQTGENVLTFNLYNAPSGWASGVRIEMDGTVMTAVPEPSTYAMLGLGLAMLGLIVTRRRS